MAQPLIGMQRHIDYPRWQPLLSKGLFSKGLANLFITDAEGWSGMYQMRRLLSRGEWLLEEEPRGTQSLPRGSISFHVLLRPGATPTGPLRGRERLRRPRFSGPGADVLCWAALYALPTHRGKTMLWLRVAHALSLVGGLALIVYIVAAEAREVWEPLAFAAVTVLLLFLVLLFRYRRQRGRRYY